jgi:hopanoid biosynthesis associated RND transporter like protein HpnN
VLAWWADRVVRNARAVVLTTIPVVVLLSYYVFTHLGINTETDGMMSDDLPWRRDYLAFEQKFSLFKDEILIVIEGQTPDIADDVRRHLAGRLQADTALVRSVYVPGGGEFFDRNGLLYLEEERLQDLSASVSRFSRWIRDLERDPTLVGLMSALDGAMQEAAAESETELRTMLQVAAGVFHAQLEGTGFRVSWWELFQGRRATHADRRQFITVRPRLEFSELGPARTTLARVESIVAELPRDTRGAVRVRATGSLVIESDAFTSALTSTLTAGGLALLAVGVTLYIGLGSLPLIAASLLTLLAGLCGTAAFAAVAVGDLNMISIAFSILYIGLGIDYAIHLCLGYREIRAEGVEHGEALRRTSERVGRSLVLSAVTTAACFYAFIPTDFVGLGELGLISGTGMFISLFVTLTLLPAFLTVLPRAPAAGVRPMDVRGARSWLARHRHGVLAAAGFAFVISVALLPRVRFDPDHLSLSDPSSPSLQTYRSLLADTTVSLLTVSVVRPGHAEAVQAADRLAELEEVRAAITLADFVPGRQPEKLALFAAIDSALGPPPEAAASPPDLDAGLAAVRRVASTTKEFQWRTGSETARAARDLRVLMRRWERALEEWPPSGRAGQLQTLEAGLVGSLPARLGQLRTGLSAREFTESDLPADLRERWIGPSGERRVEVIPAGRIDTSDRQHRFVEAVRSVAADATGTPVNDMESAGVTVRSFQSALLGALGATALLLLLLLRRPVDVTVVLIPLFLAGALTGAIAYLIGLSFNFANVIALPLLLGVGVDNGIHMVHRARTAPPADGDLMHTSTSRAVLFATLTTTLSFGNLAISTHRGLSTMGQLLTLGMLCVLACTLLVLPALLFAYDSLRRPQEVR